LVWHLSKRSKTYERSDCLVWCDSGTFNGNDPSLADPPGIEWLNGAS